LDYSHKLRIWLDFYAPRFVDDYFVAVMCYMAFVAFILMQTAFVQVAKAKAKAKAAAKLPWCNTPDPDYSDRIAKLKEFHETGYKFLPVTTMLLAGNMALEVVSSWWLGLVMQLFLALRLTYILVFSRLIFNVKEEPSLFHAWIGLLSVWMSWMARIPVLLLFFTLIGSLQI